MTPLPRGKWNFQDIYKWGGILHRDIGDMAVLDLMAAVRGYAEAKPGAKPKGKGNMTEDRLSELGIAGF